MPETLIRLDMYPLLPLPPLLPHTHVQGVKYRSVHLIVVVIAVIVVVHRKLGRDVRVQASREWHKIVKIGKETDKSVLVPASHDPRVR